jgi:ComEC/Rec2-related protein
MHWIVVSGSHLVLVEKIILSSINFLQKIFGRCFLKGIFINRLNSLAEFFRFSLLVLYLFCTGLQAPAVRSFFQMEFTKKFKISKFKISSLWLCLFSGIGTLLLFPQWVSSLSLPLSWTASLALMISGIFPQKSEAHQFLQNHLGVFLFMFPLLTQISTPNPLALAVSLILTPVFAFILFPLSLLSLVIHPLSQIIDPILEFLIEVIQKILPELAMNESSLQRSGPFQKLHFGVWVYVLCLNFLVVVFCIYKNRKSLLNESS